MEVSDEVSNTSWRWGWVGFNKQREEIYREKEKGKAGKSMRRSEGENLVSLKKKKRFSMFMPQRPQIERIQH